MARAFIGNVTCRVLVDRDLGESWAVTVLPPPGAKVGDRVLPPLVVKLQGEDRLRVLKGGLEILQKAGQLDRFELDASEIPPPPPPPAPVAAKPAAAPAAPAAAASPAATPGAPAPAKPPGPTS